MRRPTRRPERVAKVLQETIASYLQFEAREPELGFVTVTGVDVSRDLSHARIRVSVMGEEDVKTTTLEALRGTLGRLRSHVAGELRMRHVPELDFVLDRGSEHAQRINKILAELNPGEDQD